MPAEKVVIDRLHVHGPGPVGPGEVGPVGLRLGLEQALGQLRPRPAHLPPQAILVVRRLTGPTAFGPRPVDRRRWQRQLEDQLEQLARKAVRPIRQHVSPAANAILFADPVELLLCCGRDLLAGRWPWYWDELFPVAGPGRPFGERLLAAWLAQPQAVPQALVALAPSESSAILGRLTMAELAHLARSLHDIFALPTGALDAAVDETARPEPAAPEADTPTGSAAAPWREWLPAGAAIGLTPAAVYVLGLSHTLVHRPQQARRPEFGRQAGFWLASALAAERATAAALRPERSPPPAAGREAAPESAAPGLSLTGLSPAGAARDRELSSVGPAAEAAADPVDLSGTAFAPWGDGTFTRLGGAIHFVNLLARLGLPEAIPALAGLNPWELLGGLAMALLGEMAEEYTADPLWAALNELAGLEPDRPWGASLPPPDAFRLPAAWLDRLPPRRILAHRRPGSGRLQLWTADPVYLLADLPADAPLTEWPLLDRHLAAPLRLEELPDAAGPLMTPQLAWWVRRLRPYLACYLAHLLGLDDPAAAVANLFHQPATLYLSRTHLDLVQSVEQISLPLRRAGLDQNPGWRPEFGYIITTHFE
jgi:hypothetical protein